MSLYIIDSTCAPTNLGGATAEGTLGDPCSLRVEKFKAEGLILMNKTNILLIGINLFYYIYILYFYIFSRFSTHAGTHR